MCDQVVCDVCRDHLEVNQSAFASPLLELIHSDARGELEDYPGTFDVIIGDLADPLEDGPCFQLYTRVCIQY
jgi:thermospermine synthase